MKKKMMNIGIGFATVVSSVLWLFFMYKIMTFTALVLSLIFTGLSCLFLIIFGLKLVWSNI